MSYEHSHEWWGRAFGSNTTHSFVRCRCGRWIYLNDVLLRTNGESRSFFILHQHSKSINHSFPFLLAVTHGTLSLFHPLCSLTHSLSLSLSWTRSPSKFNLLVSFFFLYLWSEISELHVEVPFWSDLFVVGKRKWKKKEEVACPIKCVEDKLWSGFA